MTELLDYGEFDNEYVVTTKLRLEKNSIKTFKYFLFNEFTDMADKMINYGFILDDTNLEPIFHKLCKLNCIKSLEWFMKKFKCNINNLIKIYTGFKNEVFSDDVYIVVSKYCNTKQINILFKYSTSFDNRMKLFDHLSDNYVFENGDYVECFSKCDVTNIHKLIKALVNKNIFENIISEYLKIYHDYYYHNFYKTMNMVLDNPELKNVDKISLFINLLYVKNPHNQLRKNINKCIHLHQ